MAMTRVDQRSRPHDMIAASLQRTILIQIEMTHTRKRTGYFVLPESSILGERISLTLNS